MADCNIQVSNKEDDCSAHPNEKDYATLTMEEDYCNLQPSKEHRPDTYAHFYVTLLSEDSLIKKKNAIYALLTNSKLSLVIFRGAQDLEPNEKYVFLENCPETRHFLLSVLDKSLHIQAVRIESNNKFSLATHIVYKFSDKEKKELSFNMSDTLHGKQLLDVLDLT